MTSTITDPQTPPTHPTMPERPEPNHTQDQTELNNSIWIIQINLNKSERAHLDIINDRVSSKYDIMLIQEPHMTTFNAIQTPANLRPVYPKNRLQNKAQIRLVIWVNKKLNTKDWIILDIPETNDITAIQLKGPYRKLSIFNIYNDCTHSRNKVILNTYIRSNSNIILETDNHHMIWAGDFNRHHPLWDDNKDIHLFTHQAIRRAEGLIEIMADYNLAMTLLKGIPTLQHMRTKKYSRPDNFFCTEALQEMITKCKVDPSSRPTSTDHFPIITHIQLPQDYINTPPSERQIGTILSASYVSDYVIQQTCRL